jgi:hypothetical protein
MARGRLRRLLEPSAQRRLEDLIAEASARGWTGAQTDRSPPTATLAGRASDGSDFAFEVSLFSDTQGTPDFVEWSSGPHRLDELLLALTNAPDPARRWLFLLEEGVALAHDDPDPQWLRDELNARAAEGMSPRDLNECALQLGAGGATGVLQRFSLAAAEMQDELRHELPAAGGLQILAADRALAWRLLREPVGSLLSSAVRAASVQREWSFLAWVGLPYSRLRMQVPTASLELLQTAVELGVALRREALRGREW